ncbi:MAG: hypothetical protein ABI232_06440 [Jatrophihabitantaceae bacterium]
MTEQAQAVMTAVRRRLADEPDQVLPTLRLLADPDALADEVDEPTISLAKTLNAHRVVALLRELRARSYTTAEVADMLGGVSRQAVSQRVANRRLAAIEISGKSHFPSWQFVDGHPAAGLPAVIAALAEARSGMLSADAVMCTVLPEEGGRTPADLLAVGDVDRALHYVRVIGSGF